MTCSPNRNPIHPCSHRSGVSLDCFAPSALGLRFGVCGEKLRESLCHARDVRRGALGGPTTEAQKPAILCRRTRSKDGHYTTTATRTTTNTRKRRRRLRRRRSTEQKRPYKIASRWFAGTAPCGLCLHIVRFICLFPLEFRRKPEAHKRVTRLELTRGAGGFNFTFFPFVAFFRKFYAYTSLHCWGLASFSLLRYTVMRLSYWILTVSFEKSGRVSCRLGSVHGCGVATVQVRSLSSFLPTIWRRHIH